MKQKMISGLVGCVLLVLLLSSAYATGGIVYSLEELGLSVTMPSDFTVFTREVEDGDPFLNAHGVSKDDLIELMKEVGLYLIGWGEDVEQEVSVTMHDSSLTDFNLCDDAMLSIMLDLVELDFTQSGKTPLQSEIYQHSQSKFIYHLYSQTIEGSTVFFAEYYTSYNDMVISILLTSYSGEITAPKEEMLKAIVDSVRFHTAQQIVEAGFTPTDAFSYTDSKTGASFVVPPNWVEAPFFEERHALDMKFTSLEEPGMAILYASADLWNEMTASEREGYKRSDFKNSMFSKAEIAAMYGIAENDVATVTYGGNEFFKASVIFSPETYGKGDPFVITYIITVINGCTYAFQFNGTSDDPLYDDFESLLASVTFENPENESGLPTSSVDDILRNFPYWNLLLQITAVIAVCALPIIVYRYAICRAPVANRKAARVTVFYGAIVFVLSSSRILNLDESGIIGAAILLWSFVNYRILVGGTSKRAKPSTVDAYWGYPVPSNPAMPDGTAKDTTRPAE